MSNTDYIKEHLYHYFSSSIVDEIIAVSTAVILTKDSAILDTGSQISVIPFVLSGSVKVFREDEDGNEILIYYLLPGETCALTLNSCIINEGSKVKATIESDAELLLIPSDKLMHWIDRYPDMKHFLIKVFNQRFENLLEVIQDLAFNKLDQRILSYLRNKSLAINSNTIDITHQRIANEIGTSREVVSRLLKQLEQQNHILLSRHSIKIL